MEFQRQRRLPEIRVPAEVTDPFSRNDAVRIQRKGAKKPRRKIENSETRTNASRSAGLRISKQRCPRLTETIFKSLAPSHLCVESLLPSSGLVLLARHAAAAHAVKILERAADQDFSVRLRRHAPDQIRRAQDKFKPFIAANSA